MGQSFTLFIVLVLIYTTRVFCFDSYNYLLEYRNPDTIYSEFTTGDIIACRIHSSVGSAAAGAEHTMLATSLTQVAHVDANGKEIYFGHLKEEPFKVVAERGEYTMCRIATTQYDLIMFNKGTTTARNPEEARNAARDWINRGTTRYYDFTGCNCQHWVTEWRYGKAWSPQSNQPPSSQCVLSDQFSSSSSAQATAYSKPGQTGAKAEAATGKIMGGGGIPNYALSGPSASASASAGVSYTGAGFQARLGEVRGNLGNSFGASLGLAADTGIGFGSDGARVEVLGTGIQYSRSSGGTRVCLFGSCLYVG